MVVVLAWAIIAFVTSDPRAEVVVGLAALVVSLVTLLPGAPRPPEDLDRYVKRLAVEVRGMYTRWAKDAGLEEGDHLEIPWSLTAFGQDDLAQDLLRCRDLTRLIEEFAGHPGHKQLIVTGASGSGKSTVGWRLITIIADRVTSSADSSACSPLPVWLSLATWDEQESYEQWVSRRLVTITPTLGDAGIDPETGAARTVTDLLEKSRLLLILDGLDELAPDRREQVVDELVKRHPPYVLTCRSEEFEASKASRVLSAPNVELLPVRAHQAADFLRGAGSGGSDPSRLLERLEAEPGGPLARALSSPLMIFLAAAQYRRGHDIDDVLGADQAEIEEHLIGRYIPAVYGTRTEGSPWTAEQARHWLGHLARILDRRSANEPAAEDSARETTAEESAPKELAWWELREEPPRWFFPAMHAVSSGVVLALLGWGLLAPFALPWMGFWTGLAIGVVGGIGFNLARQDPVRQTRLALATVPPGYVRRTVTHAAAVALLGGIVVWFLYDGLLTVVLHVLVFSSAFVLTRVLFVPAAPEDVGGPLDLLRHDRRTVLFAFAAGALAGLPMGAVLGAAFQDRLSDFVREGLGPDAWLLGLQPWHHVVLGAGWAMLLGAFGIGASSMAVSAWGGLAGVRFWLAPQGRIPWRLMTFLEDACEKGVLRRSGPYYVFRHDRLYRNLLDPPPTRTELRARVLEHRTPPP